MCLAVTLEPVDQSALQSLDPPFVTYPGVTLSQCDDSRPKGATQDLDYFVTSSLTACAEACNSFNLNLSSDATNTVPGNIGEDKYYCNAAEWADSQQYTSIYKGVKCAPALST